MSLKDFVPAVAFGRAAPQTICSNKTPHTFDVGSKRFVAGFHAVQASLCSRLSSVVQLWYNDKRKDRRMTTTITTAQSLGIKTTGVSRQSLTKLAWESNLEGQHQDIIALAKRTSGGPLDLKTSRLVLALDGVTDVNNIGSCLRVAEAFGVEVVLAKAVPGAGDLSSISKTSSGASQIIPQVHTTNLNGILRLLKEIGHIIIGASCQSAPSVYDVKLDVPLTLVIGSEDKGLSSAVKKVCDILVQVPMHGRIPSLNASVACGIMLSEIRRRLVK